MNARLIAVSSAAVFAATLAGLAHAADIAWHATSVSVVRQGANSETKTSAVFKSGDRAEVTGYGTNLAESNGVRPIAGFAVIRFADLSSIVVKNDFIYDAGSHSSKGSGEFVAGSGRFRGITGKVECVTKYSSHDAWETDCVGSYALPSP